MKTAHPRNLPDNGNRTLRNATREEARGRLGTPGRRGEDPNCRDGSRLGADPSGQDGARQRSAGQFSRRGPPTGIARERETRVDDAEPRQRECRTTFAVKMQPHAGPHRSRWRRPQGNADLRSAQRPAGPRRRRPQPSGRFPSRRVPLKAGRRAKRSAGQFSRWGPPTGIARERETRTDDATPRQSDSGASRWGPPTGIARERETSADDAAPRQCECRVSFMRTG